MHHRSERAIAKQSAIDLMKNIIKSNDAINDSEKTVARKVASNYFSGFNSLSIGEIDDVIDLVGYYWGDEDKNTTVLIDLLLEYRYLLESSANN